jgi:hypothetical protein
MADPFHPFSIDADGRRVSAIWALKQGNCLCVSWGDHVEHIELKPGERPELRAAAVLRIILKKDRAQREREQRAFEAKRRKLSPNSGP